MSFHLFPSLPTELRLKIYNHIANLTSSRRILKISHSPMLERYTSNTAPPLILSLSAESRAWAQTQYSYLSLGPSSNSWSNPRLDPSAKPWSSDAKLPVPICYATDTLYISGLSPLFPSQLSNTLYHLSTSGSRHWIQSLAVDLRVWNELCENGFLGVLGRMKGLREVLLVLEFGRNFRGELGFLEAPEWYVSFSTSFFCFWLCYICLGDVKQVADILALFDSEYSDMFWDLQLINDRRMDLGWIAGNAGKELESERDRARGIMKENKREEKKESVSVRCVILTRGGEQA